MNDQPAAIPWYKSNVLRGIFVVVVTHALTHYKLISQFTPTDIGEFVDEMLSAVGFLAAGFAAYARVHQSMPAVTTTKAKADEINTPPLPQPPETKP